MAKKEDDSKFETVEPLNNDNDNDHEKMPESAVEQTIPAAVHPRTAQIISEEKKLKGLSSRKTSEEISRNILQEITLPSSREHSVSNSLPMQRRGSGSVSSDDEVKDDWQEPACAPDPGKVSRSFFRRSSSLHTDPANIQKIKEYFKESIAGGEKVQIMKYTRAYKEIVKFLCVLGTILSFASRDIESKVNRMDELLSSEEGKNYLFLDDMLKYELKAGITNADGIEQVKSQKGKRYGTRIMFRLHQAMAFLVQFFINVREQPHSKIHSIVNDAYKATISRNHSWLVRKTATIAFYAIPSRNTLIGRMGHDTSEQKLMDELKEIIDITTDVYALIAKVFDKYSLVALNEPKTPTGNLKKSSSESAMTSKSKQV